MEYIREIEFYNDFAVIVTYNDGTMDILHVDEIYAQIQPILSNTTKSKTIYK